MKLIAGCLTLLPLLAFSGPSFDRTEASPPIVWMFEASKTTVLPGESVTVSWIVIAADRVEIDHGVGSVGLAGSKTVVLDEPGTATIILTASNSAGAATALCEVEVLVFRRLIGGMYNDEGTCIRATQDGGYVLTGTLSSKSTSGADSCLLKLDADGQVLWQKTYGGGNVNDYGQDVRPTLDGGFVIAAASFGLSDLVKTDAAGNKVWEKNIAHPPQNAYCVWPTPDGGYLVGCENGHILKADSFGATLWDKTYTKTDRFYSVLPAADGGFVFAGRYYDSSLAWDVILIKVDAAGNLVWRKQFGGTGHEYGYCVVEAAGGGYLVVGTTLPQGSGVSIFLVRTDASGNKNWEKTISNETDMMSAEAYSAVAMEDGGFVLAGKYATGTDNVDDVLVVKVDGSGAVVWSKLVGTTLRESARSIARAPDGGFVITGTSTDNPGMTDDILIIKVR